MVLCNVRNDLFAMFFVCLPTSFGFDFLFYFFSTCDEFPLFLWVIHVGLQEELKNDHVEHCKHTYDLIPTKLKTNRSIFVWRMLFGRSYFPMGTAYTFNVAPQWNFAYLFNNCTLANNLILEWSAHAIREEIVGKTVTENWRGKQSYSAKKIKCSRDKWKGKNERKREK